MNGKYNIKIGTLNMGIPKLLIVKGGTTIWYLEDRETFLTFRRFKCSRSNESKCLNPGFRCIAKIRLSTNN